MGQPSQPDLAGQIAEIYVLFVIGAVMIGARIFCRTKLVGFRNYQWDDYGILAVAGMWAMAPAIGQVFVQVAEGRHTSDLTHEERKNMSDEERAKWTYGSQIFLFGLTGYFFIIWTLKFNMVCFYSRVVRGLWTEKFIMPLMVLIIATFVAIVFTLALTCRPFQHLWQVWPDPGPLCVPQNLVFFVVILTFNLLTDLCIMVIPIPVLTGLQINRPRKIGLYLLFTLGFLCMFFAVLRFVLIFRLNHRGVSALWSMREDCVGIFVGQAPLITPMFRRRFWEQAGYATSRSRTAGRSTDGRGSGYAGYHRQADGSRGLRSVTTYVSSGGGGGKSNKSHDPYSITTLAGPDGDSQEEIMVISEDNGHAQGLGGLGDGGDKFDNDIPLPEMPPPSHTAGGILVQKSVVQKTVESEDPEILGAAAQSSPWIGRNW